MTNFQQDRISQERNGSVTLRRKVVRLLWLGLLTLSLPTGCSVFDRAFAPLRFADEVEVKEDISYKVGSANPKQRLDLFLPKSMTGPTPVAIFIHGGFWKNQDKRYYRPLTGLYWNFGFALAQRGFVTAVISYRLYPETQIAGQIEDVRSAIDWVRQHIGQYQGDPTRIHLIGHSAGGHLAAMIGAEAPPAIRSLVALSPILDTIHMKEHQPEAFNNDVVYPVFGKTDVELRKQSPAEIWSKRAVPLLILVGSLDYDFVFEQSAQFETKAQAAGWQVKRMVLENYEHADLVLIVKNQDSLIIKLASDFMREHNP